MIQLLPPSQPLGGSLKQSLSFTLLFLAFFYSIFKIKTLASAINYYKLVALIAEARVSRYHSASLYFSRNISFIGPIRPPSFYRRRCRRPLLSFPFVSDAPR